MVLLDIVGPCSVGVPQHVRVDLRDSGQPSAHFSPTNAWTNSLAESYFFILALLPRFVFLMIVLVFFVVRFFLAFFAGVLR